MKKLTLFFLTALVCVSISACGNTNGKNTSTDAPTDQKTTEKTTNASKPKEEAGWVIDNYADDFGDESSKQYIRCAEVATGTFSNVVFTDEILGAQIVIDKDDISLFLYERNEQVRNKYSVSTETYDIKIKKTNGNKVDVTGYIPSGGDRIFIDDQYKETVISALKDKGDVSFHIKSNASYGNSTYNFTVSTSNFAEIYDEFTQE